MEQKRARPIRSMRQWVLDGPPRGEQWRMPFSWSRRPVAIKARRRPLDSAVSHGIFHRARMSVRMAPVSVCARIHCGRSCDPSRFCSLPVRRARKRLTRLRAGFFYRAIRASELRSPSPRARRRTSRVTPDSISTEASDISWPSVNPLAQSSKRSRRRPCRDGELAAVRRDVAPWRPVRQAILRRLLLHPGLFAGTGGRRWSAP